jgi:pyridoxal phosphate enzyme (YggS family)
VDDVRLGERLERAAEEQKKPLPVLVQVKLGDEQTKAGLDEQHLFPALEMLRSSKRLRLEGLMTLPPYAEDPEILRPFFRRLRELRDKAKVAGLLLGSELSMGMSHDLEVAVEEGATMVRVGTAVFGARTARKGA